MTPATFTKVWNRKAKEIECPARAEFGKRSFKAFTYRGQDSGGFEVWFPISIGDFEKILERFPAMNAVKT